MRLWSKIISKSYLAVTIVFLGAVVCTIGITGRANAAEDSGAKYAVGDANAEANPAADPIKNCGPAPADKDASSWGKYFKKKGVNMRRLPKPNSLICGQGQKSHKVDYHCWTTGSDGYTWSYVRDVNTHYAGWVRDNLLVGNGSLVHC
jgi:ABC-type cobalt transport system substrate-binding protein